MIVMETPIHKTKIVANRLVETIVAVDIHVPETRVD